MQSRVWNQVACLLGLMCAQSLAGQVRRAPSLLPPWAIDQDAFAPESLTRLSGVGLGHSLDSVIRLLGAPERQSRYHSEILDSVVVLEYGFGRLLLDAYGVQDFDCWGEPCELGGIHVGTTLRVVVDVAGRGRSGYGSEPTRLLIYPIRDCDCWVQVEFGDDERVRELGIHFDNS